MYFVVLLGTGPGFQNAAQKYKKLGVCALDNRDLFGIKSLKKWFFSGLTHAGPGIFEPITTMNPHLDPHTGQNNPEEQQVEKALRPKALEDFSGQPRIVENHKVFISAAKQR